MRKLILLSAIAAGAMFSTKANAQIGVSLGVHFGGGYAPSGHVVVTSPPPVVYTEPVVYDDYADDNYYYLPDVDAYYDVTGNVYYYNDGRRWVSAAYLPGHRDYNWRTARRYEIRANRPYLNHSYYSSRFNTNRGSWNNDARRYNERPEMRRNDRFDNRGNNNYNRPQGGFNRGNNYPQQQYNRPQGGFSQPQSQPQNRPQGGGFNQPQQNTQPSRGGNGRGNDGGEQRFSGNNSQGGMHRFARS
jgi:hypothetical protein